MRLDLKKKLINLSLIVFGGILLLFVVVFNGAYWGSNAPGGEGRDLGMDNLYIVIGVVLPILGSIICFLLSGYFKSFTKQDAINQVEKQYKNGIISFDMYKATLEGIEKHELEQFKLKASIEIEKEKIKKQIMNNAKEELDKTISLVEKPIEKPVEKETKNNKNEKIITTKSYYGV